MDETTRLNTQVSLDIYSAFQRVIKIRKGRCRGELGGVLNMLMKEYVDDFQKSYLFCAPAKHKIELKTGNVGRELRGCFEQNGMHLTVTASLHQMNDVTWGIKDEKSNYSIEMQPKKLIIHNTDSPRGQGLQ